jgi:hypothetical protein
VILVKQRMGKQEYSITVKCTSSGRGSFSFKAYDAKSLTTALDLVSDACFFVG